MHHDFSVASQQRLLQMMNDVENVTIKALLGITNCIPVSFTHWMRVLELSGYADRANSYNGTVFNKNSVAMKAANELFDRERDIDKRYQHILYDDLYRIEDVIADMKDLGDIIRPYSGILHPVPIFNRLLRNIPSRTIYQYHHTFAAWNAVWNEYGWEGILAGSGYIGTIYGFIQDIKNGATWRDFTKTGVDVYRFLTGAVKTYNNYKKIGRAVGTSKAMAWWAKSIVGLKSLGRVSTANNPFVRFAHNLTNKTSPFHAQFQDVVKNFKGANGVGKAVASWGSVAVTGVTNWFSNREEQKASNGTMSDARVVAETITETAVDTVLTYGAGIAVGAAAAAILPVAAPGIVVVAVSGLVVAGINAGVKALTGKSTTEWISDTILDTGKKVIDNQIKQVKNVAKSIGKWFNKLSFA